MDPQRELERMLEEHGAVLVRDGRHLVYKLPNGQTFVQSKTPGDAARGARNSLSDLRHALGQKRHERRENPVPEHFEAPQENPVVPRVKTPEALCVQDISHEEPPTREPGGDLAEHRAKVVEVHHGLKGHDAVKDGNIFEWQAMDIGQHVVDLGERAAFFFHVLLKFLHPLP